MRKVVLKVCLVVALAAVGLGACKQGLGDRCQLQSDCEADLTCAADNICRSTIGNPYPPDAAVHVDAATPDAAPPDAGTSD